MPFHPACHSYEPVTIADRLFLDLRRAILEGELPAGKKISEPELASIYGVSRGSLREAISKLENCNLVTRRPNIGARIVNFSIDQLMEIYQIREAMVQHGEITAWFGKPFEVGPVKSGLPV